MDTNDLAAIRKLIWDWFQEDGAKSIARLEKGMTNRSYHVELEAGHFVFRLPGFGTEEIISRENEYICNKIACDLDIDTPLHYFDKTTGVKISGYIENPVTMSAGLLNLEKHIHMVAGVYRKLHNCGIDSGVPFDVPDYIEGYERYIIKNGIGFYDGYEEIKLKIHGICDIYHKDPMSKVQCHNDALCENWIVGGEGRMYLVDWEYAGMNDPMWDISVVSIEAGMEPENDLKLLTAYLGRKPTGVDMERFLANKVLLDFLWSLWGKTRIPASGPGMEEYALGRYERMLGNLRLFENKDDLQ